MKIKFYFSTFVIFFLQSLILAFLIIIIIIIYNNVRIPKEGGKGKEEKIRAGMSNLSCAISDFYILFFYLDFWHLILFCNNN